MTRLPVLLVLLLPALLSPAWGADPEGYRLLESTAASVNGEVIFRSDVVREACLYRCGAHDNAAPAGISLSSARERMIGDVLVLQEQRKLGLGAQDNAAVEAAAAPAFNRLKRCDAPCARAITPAEVREFIGRKRLVKEFLEKRVSVFVEVKDEDVRMEIRNRASRPGAGSEDLSEETVRRDLYAAKVATEIRNWYAKAASKSRIFLSPLEGP